MPLQTIQDIHIDRALTNYSVLQVSQRMIADDAAPILPVENERDQFYKYNLDHMRLWQAELAPRAPAGEVDFNVTRVSYAAREYGFKKFISERERNAADAPPLNLEAATTRFVTELLKLDREFRIAATMTTAGNYTNTSTPSNKWDTSSGTPISDIVTAKVAVQASTFTANQLTTSEEAAQEIAVHSTILDLQKYVRDMSTTDGLPDPFLGLKTVVAKSRFLTNNLGQAETTGAVWGLHAIISYAEHSPGLETGGHYQTFRHQDPYVRRWYDDELKCDVIEIRMMEDVVRIIDVAGYLYTNVTT